MHFDSKVFEDWEKALVFIDPSDRYIRSYPELLAASKCLVDNFGEKSVPMVAHLVYGWMPTILEYSREPNQDNEIFQAVTTKTTNEALQVVEAIECPPTKNASPDKASWVGMSKTLHFLNAEMFPIWDGNVAGVLGVSSNKRSKKDIYKKYMEFVFSNTQQHFVNNVREAFKYQTGCQISKVRAVEFTLFAIGKS